MARADELARPGWGRTWPNPLVGAVVVRDGVVVGEGGHAEFGGPHAEAIALQHAGERARGATLYVTLEPCAHVGKQPACTEMILASGVARVVYAIADPNPVARGGAARLAVAGVAVESGVLAAAAARENFRFLHEYTDTNRPFVAVKLAVSMDGFIADRTGQSRWIAGEAARDWVHWLRAGFGGIAVGAATAATDHARLTVRGPVVPRIPPRRIIFDRSGRADPSMAFFRQPGHAAPIVVQTSSADPARRDVLQRAGAEVVVADTLVDGLAALRRGGVDSMLVEGGGRLAGALLGEGLVDRVYQMQSPLWLGAGTPAWSGVSARALADAERWTLVDTRTFADAGDVLIELERR